MKARQDINLDLMTLPELVAECSTLRPKIMGNTATVREVRRFAMLHSLVIMFEQAKRNCAPNRKAGENIGQQVKQDLISAGKRVNRGPIENPVLHNGLNGFQSEDINDI